MTGCAVRSGRRSFVNLAARSRYDYRFFSKGRVCHGRYGPGEAMTTKTPGAGVTV
jgi:hypothetical protein